MKFHITHNEQKRLKCVHNSIAIKNKALEKKYPGRLLSFLDNHGGQSNGKITVVCYMGGDVYETIDDLTDNGLEID